MSIDRRRFILSAGGACLALALGTGVYRVTRMPATAAAPWEEAGAGADDVRLDAFRHAILAPNPHNRQPWLIRLTGDDGADILCDLDRRLPETDPFDRQITIGFGCFLELARIAAAERGYRADIEMFPEGEPSPRLDGRPIARLRFVRDDGVGRDPLFAFLRQRRSTKEPYDLGRPVEAEKLARLMAIGGDLVSVGATSTEAEVARIRALILDAGAIEATLPRTHLESVRLMRIGHAEIDAQPDGIDLGGPMIEALKLAGQISREQIADPSSAAYTAGLDLNREVYGSVPAAIWIATEGNARSHQLEAGRVHVRTNLLATALGLSLHPASQALQEFPEMAKANERAHQILGAEPGRRVQLLSRLGYGPDVPPSPRWPLTSKLLAT